MRASHPTWLEIVSGTGQVIVSAQPIYGGHYYGEGAEIRNPRPEIRRKAEDRNPNQTFRRWTTVRPERGATRFSEFGFPSAFGFRFSDLGAVIRSCARARFSDQFSLGRRRRWGRLDPTATESLRLRRRAQDGLATRDHSRPI